MSNCSICKWEQKCENAHENDFCLNFDRRPLTNADRIRAMTDEELTETLFDVANYSCPPGKEFTTALCGKYPDCKMCWLDWLRREVVG